MEIVHSQERLIKLLAKPNVKAFQRFNDDLAAVQMTSTSIFLSRPIYAGMVILDLSKLLMYNFYYNVLKQKYKENVTLLFTDTDSLCLRIQTEDLYRDMLTMQNELDCSDYPVDHFLHDVKNKKALGKFKDEMSGSIVTEYVGLRSKMYSLQWTEGNVRRCKGVSKAITKNVLKHSMYKDCLFNGEQRSDEIVKIGSSLHNLYTFNMKKVSLSPFDDKRFVLNNKINTLAYGHVFVDLYK